MVQSFYLNVIEVDVCGFQQSCFFVVIDSEYNVICGNAAHRKAIYIPAAGPEIEQIDSGGMFIGAMQEANDTYEEKRMTISKGDKILLYTDCLIESVGPGNKQYGVKRLLESVKRNARLEKDEFIDALLNDLHAFIGERERVDDLSILLIERT